MNEHDYRVEFTRAAAKEFRKLERLAQKRLSAVIKDLTKDPRPHGVKKLTGHDNAYRIRVGDFRIIYEINDTAVLITVVRVGDRKDVYDSF